MEISQDYMGKLPFTAGSITMRRSMNSAVAALVVACLLSFLPVRAEETAAEQGITRDAYLADRAARIPMGQFTEIDDLTGLAQFLVSDSARLITGQAIAPDGGVMTSS